MVITASSAIFMLATKAYLGIRLYFSRRRAGSAVAVSRVSAGDRALVAGVVAGQIVLPLLALWSPWLDSARRAAPGPALLASGTALMALGLWLFWRSHADLGRQWSVTLELQQDHRLVSSGVYRWLRHPMYASFFLMAAGQALLVPNWIAGPAAGLAVSLLYAVRTPREEAMLAGQFGEAYQRYAASTGALWPRFGARRA